MEELLLLMTFFKKQKKIENPYLTDKQLVKTILSANDPTIKRQLQEDLYHRFAERIYFKCFSIVKSKEIAKDLTHDIIIKIFFNLGKYSGTSEFYPWVAAITYNHCINWLNKEKKLKIEPIENHAYQIGQDDSGEAIAIKVLEELQLSQLERLFQQLKEAEKIVLLMRYQDGLSVKNIASILKISESAVKMRLKRGRDHLIRLVKEESI